MAARSFIMSNVPSNLVFQNTTGDDMKAYIYLISGLFILILLAGCAATKVTSFRDPAFSAVNYERVLVVIPFADFELEQTAETAFVDEFAVNGIYCTAAIKLFSPTRNYTKQEIDQMLREQNIDAILSITLTDARTDSTYVPESTTSTTSGKINVIGDTGYYSGITTTQRYGGYYISKPHVSFKGTLFDVKTGKVAWVSTATTRGNAYATAKIMANSAAEAIVGKLLEDGLIKSKR